MWNGKEQDNHRLLFRKLWNQISWKLTYRCFNDAIVDFEIKTEELKMANLIWQKWRHCQIFMKS